MNVENFTAENVDLTGENSCRSLDSNASEWNDWKVTAYLINLNLVKRDVSYYVYVGDFVTGISKW